MQRGVSGAVLARLGPDGGASAARAPAWAANLARAARIAAKSRAGC